MSLMEVDASDALADAERLAELEAVIDRGLALIEIQQQKLYRLTHPSFPAYLRERWELSWSRAQQLTTTAKVNRAILEGGGKAPEASEYALRQLALC